MKKSSSFSILFLVFFIHLTWCQTNQEDVSNVKWGKAGSHPSEYNMGGDPFSVSADQTGFVKSIGDNPEGFGTWMTSIKPGEYLGKRVKLSVNLKSKDVENWASMWMRVDGKGKEQLSFDNMENRVLKGNDNWKTYDIVLDVPENSAYISYGVMLSGKGQIWAKDLQFQIVNESVPVTDMN